MIPTAVKLNNSNYSFAFGLPGNTEQPCKVKRIAGGMTVTNMIMHIVGM